MDYGFTLITNYAVTVYLTDLYDPECMLCRSYWLFSMYSSMMMIIVGCLILANGIYMDILDCAITLVSFLNTLGICICAAHQRYKLNVFCIVSATMLLFTYRMLGGSLPGSSLLILFAQVSAILLIDQDDLLPLYVEHI